MVRGATEEEMLDVEAVAQFLRVSKSKVYQLAQKGQIPAAKVAGQWRFRRAELDEWLAENSARRVERSSAWVPAQEQVPLSFEILTDALLIWQEDQAGYPPNEQVAKLLRRAADSMLLRIPASLVDLVAVEYQRSFVPMETGEQQNTIVHVMVGELAGYLDKVTDPYPRGYPFLDWSEDVHLRIRIVGNPELMDAPLESDREFRVPLDVIEDALRVGSGRLDSQIEIIQRRWFTRMQSRSARQLAAQIAIASTAYSRALMGRGGEELSLPDGLDLPHSDERNILFIPVLIGGVPIGGAAVLSHFPLAQDLARALDLAVHLLLYRLRTGDDAHAAKQTARAQARWETAMLYAHRLAHDVKKPVELVRSSIARATAASDALTPEAARELLKRLDSQLKSFQDLISTQVGLAPDEMRRQAARDATSENLLALLEDSAWPWSQEAADQGKSVSMSVKPSRDETARLPKFLVAEVLGNLISNAVRFARSRVFVTAEVIRYPGLAVRFTVVDDGPGFAEGLRSVVGISTDDEGVPHGLGLQISRYIVSEILGGKDLNIESSADETIVSFVVPQVPASELSDAG